MPQHIGRSEVRFSRRGRLLIASKRSRSKASVGVEEAAEVPAPSTASQASRAAVLGATTISARASEGFSTAYTTLLSIVQGIALGLLAQQASTKLHADTVRGDAHFWLACGAVLASVIVVSYMYNWFTVMLRWTPNVLDTVIPFALGLAEIALVYAIGQRQAWLIALVVFETVGLLAFFNSAVRCRRDLFADETAHRRVRSLLYGLVAITGASIAMTITVFMLHRIGTITLDTATLVMPVGVILLAFAEVLVSERTLGTVYKGLSLIEH